MVSTNPSPPIAMPVQVPPGHVVQQIVDESGTLRHVILSPQHPGGVMTMPSHHHYVRKRFIIIIIIFFWTYVNKTKSIKSH